MKRYRTVWCTYTLVCLGVLTAISVILSQILGIPVGNIGRVQLGAVARIMAGIWFGPVAGAMCGLASDLLGCLIRGYAVNPLITLAAILWGVIPSLFVPQPGSAESPASKKTSILMLCIGTILTCIVCTLFVTTAGLVLINGYSLYATLPTRLVQFALQTPVYCVLVCLLYFSPITSQINRSLSIHTRRSTSG